jgi:hypothetical protein
MANVRVYGGGGAKARQSGEGSPLIAGLLAGIVLIVAWIVLARMTGKDVGLAAWGVGGLLGIAIAKSARPPTRATGIQAAILTAVILLVGKVAIVVYGLQPALRAEMVRDRDATAKMLIFDMLKNRSFSPEVQHLIDTRPELARDTSFMGPGEELRAQMISEAEARAKTATPEERERLVRTYYDQTVVREIGFWFLFVLAFTPLDLLWVGLGIASAWKLGQGKI